MTKREIKLLPYKLIIGIASVMFSISAVITWILHSITEVDFKFFILEYGVSSVLLLSLSLIIAWFFVLKPLNVAIDAIEFKYQNESGVENEC